jgi:hypothetical protein
MNIDNRKMHYLGTTLNHRQYMQFRAAIKKKKVNCSTFVRYLITKALGLDDDGNKKELEPLDVIHYTPHNPVRTRKIEDMKEQIISALKDKPMTQRDLMTTLKPTVNFSSSNFYDALRKLKRVGKVNVITPSSSKMKTDTLALA